MKSLSDFMKNRKRRFSKNKGDAFEQEVEDFFVGRGAVVDTTKLNRKFSRGRWITEKGDFLECFDHIVIFKSRSPVIFVQDTTDRGGIRAKMRKIEEKVGAPGLGREYVIATRPLEGEGIEFWRRSSGYHLDIMGAWKLVKDVSEIGLT